MKRDISDEEYRKLVWELFEDNLDVWDAMKKFAMDGMSLTELTIQLQSYKYHAEMGVDRFLEREDEYEGEEHA